MNSLLFALAVNKKLKIKNNLHLYIKFFVVSVCLLQFF